MTNWLNHSFVAHRIIILFQNSWLDILCAGSCADIFLIHCILRGYRFCISITIFLFLYKVVGIILDPFFVHCANLAFLLQQVAHLALLLAGKWHTCQLLLPLFRDQDGFFLNSFACAAIPNFVSMSNHRFNFLRMYRIPDVVHVGPGHLFAFGQFVRKVLCHAWLLQDLLIQGLHTDLVKKWWL